MALKCPNCNQEIEHGNICKQCGIDAVLFEKTLKISDMLYNKGLSLAKIRDLWGASDSLTKSIQFNKNNYYARNLLGLVYFEYGRVGDALKQWVISASMVQELNPAVKYIDIIQKNPKKLDLLDDSVNMYNNALVYIEQKSDDMAIIQLKKAVDVNPRFIDAMNLLAFCYLIQNEKHKAASLVNKVLELDNNNPIALNYYYEIYSAKPKPKVKDRPEKREKIQSGPTVSNSMMSPEKSKRLFGNNFFFAEIISFIVGGLCTLALLYTLILPGYSQENESNVAQLNDRIKTMEESFSQKENQYKITIDSLSEDNLRLNKENADYEVQTALAEKVNRINTAANLSRNGNVLDAAPIIYSVDPAGLSEDLLSLYEETKTFIYEGASTSYYNTGVSQFNSGEFDDAGRSFESCLIYALEDFRYLADATYYLGQVAEKQEDFVKAKLYYDKVVEAYQGTARASQASARIAALPEPSE